MKKMFVPMLFTYLKHSVCRKDPSEITDCKETFGNADNPYMQGIIMLDPDDEREDNRATDNKP